MKDNRLKKLKANIEEEIEKVVAKMLAHHQNTCLLKFKSGTSDYKSVARASMSMSRLEDFMEMFKGIDMERLEELKDILD